MKLLLDTHTLLWWLGDDIRLGTRARQLIGDPANDVLVSIVSLWEIVVKTRIGKLTGNIEEIAGILPHEGFELLSIDTGHLRVLAGLPMHHRDPFDHLLIAQAVAENATFISDDRNVARYQLPLVACSDAASPAGQG